MKKLITVFTFFIYLIASGQDLDFADRLNKIDSADVYSFAEEILSHGDINYKIYGQTERARDRSRIIILYDTRLPEDVILKDYNARGEYCDLCKTIQFKYYYEGSNKDLGIKGNKQYKLYEIWGTFLELVPWWREHFAPGKTNEEILNSYNLRSIKDYTKDIDIRLQKMSDEWHIINVH